MGGLSGPAIKPVALRCVHQVAQRLDVPIVGVGGIATIDDVMEFLVAGATAVQIGTANFYDPQVSMRLLEQLPDGGRRAGQRSGVRSNRAGRCELPRPAPSHVRRHTERFQTRIRIRVNHASPLRHSTDRTISLGQLFRRDSPVHRTAGRGRGVLLHRQPARADDGPRQAAAVAEHARRGHRPVGAGA